MNGARTRDRACRGRWRSARVLSPGVAVFLAWSLVACQESVTVGVPRGAGNAAAPVVPDAGASGEAEGEGRGSEAFDDDDFVEVESNRDPFRSFAHTFAVKAVEAPQRAVIMPNATVDEMRLIAIVTGGTTPRAMVIDGTGIGHVLRRGDYIGRPEVVQVGGADGVPVTLNWRVDRIRDNELVLTREDPTAPNRPPLSRVVPLHEAGTNTSVIPSSVPAMPAEPINAR